MAHALGLDVFGQFAGDVIRPIVPEQPGPVVHMGGAAQGPTIRRIGGLAAEGWSQPEAASAKVERVGDVLRPAPCCTASRR